MSADPTSQFISNIIIHVVLYTICRASNQIAQENQDRFNAEHGGITPHVTNALFTFGVNDPLLTLGVQANLSETALHYLVEDGEYSMLFVVAPISG